MALTHEERLALAVQFNKDWVVSKKASSATAAVMIRGDELTPEEAAMLIDLYPIWSVVVKYKVGDILSYLGKLYEVIQAHTSQADWTPDVVPALFKSKAPVSTIPNFVQPTGAHDAYKIGDQVMFEGKVWESLIDANVWSPTAYPQGWKEVI